MRVLPPESLKYRAIREAVLWEDDDYVYRRLLQYIKARRIANILKAHAEKTPRKKGIFKR